jgi:hypothetical protein
LDVSGIYFLTQKSPAAKTHPTHIWRHARY